MKKLLEVIKKIAWIIWIIFCVCFCKDFLDRNGETKEAGVVM